MMAWWNKTSTDYEIRIQRLDKDGTPVGMYSSIDKAALSIPLTSTGAMSLSLELTNPQVSYSPLTNEYLLVFEAKDAPMFYGIYAQRLDASGALLGDVEELGDFGPLDKRDPQVVWGGSHWLVAWNEQMWISGSFTSGLVNAQFVNTDGKKEGTDYIEVIPDGSANHEPVRIAYNAGSDNFLIVGEAPTNDAYFGYFLDNEVAQSSPAKTLIAEPQPYYAQGITMTIFPDVAADPNPSNPRFLVSWSYQEISLTGPGLRTIEVQTQLVTANGDLDGTVYPVVSYVNDDFVELQSSIAYSPESQEYVIAYEYFTETSPKYLRLVRLNQDGKVQESEIAVSDPLSAGNIQPTIGAGFGGRFLTSWLDGGDLNTQVYESPNFNPNGGGGVNPGPGSGGSGRDNDNGDGAINDTLCAGSAVNGTWGRLPESILLFGFLLLLAGYYGARRSRNVLSSRD